MTAITNLHALPPQMTSRPQWVIAGPDKIPLNPRTGQRADPTDPRTGAPFAEAVAAAETRNYSVGFILTREAGITCIDLDHCIGDDGELAPDAAAIVAATDSYTERSRSRRGVHILALGELPPGRRRTKGVEMYDCDRYIIVTGDVLPGRAEIQERNDRLATVHRWLLPELPTATAAARPTSSLTMDDTTLLAKAFAAKNGAKLERLLGGDLSEYGGDHSGADLAAASCLYFWTQDDEQVARIIGNSELGNREKWQDRADYRARTLEKARQRSAYYEAPVTTRSHADPAVDPCGAERDQLAELRAEIAALKRQLAERDATIVALTQTILNPHLTHTEKVGAVNIARHADAKRQGGQVDADGCVSLSPAEVSDDWRPKPEAGEHIAPVNPDTGTVPHMPRSSARAVLDTAIERGLLTGEKRGTVRRRADNSTFKDWEYVVSPESSFADLLNPWATWRPDQPKMRKVRESRACKHCGEVHPITRVDYCGGCGGELRRQTIEQPDAGENISPIRSVAEVRNGRNIFSHGPDVNPEEPAYLADAPQPWESAPQPALFAMPEPPPFDHRTDVAYGARR